MRLNVVAIAVLALVAMTCAVPIRSLPPTAVWPAPLVQSPLALLESREFPSKILIDFNQLPPQSFEYWRVAARLHLSVSPSLELLCFPLSEQTMVTSPLLSPQALPSKPIPIAILSFKQLSASLRSFSKRNTYFLLYHPLIECSTEKDWLQMHSVIVYPAPIPIPSATMTITSLVVKVLDSNDNALQLGVDESYILNITANGPQRSFISSFIVPSSCNCFILGAILMSNKIWGALRGLETFAQLVQWNGTAQIIPRTPISIHDAPRYPWRGRRSQLLRSF